VQFLKSEPSSKSLPVLSMADKVDHRHNEGRKKNCGCI